MISTKKGSNVSLKTKLPIEKHLSVATAIITFLVALGKLIEFVITLL